MIYSSYFRMLEMVRIRPRGLPYTSVMNTVTSLGRSMVIKNVSYSLIILERHCHHTFS